VCCKQHDDFENTDPERTAPVYIASDRLAAVLDMDTGVAQAIVRRLTDQARARGWAMDQRRLTRRCIISLLHQSGRADWWDDLRILDRVADMVGGNRLAALKEEYDSLLT
jgi:hypothetical protein